MQYWELPALSSFYFEDSYVLSIEVKRREVIFTMEIVLTEANPEYEPPKAGERYCYRKGNLVFRNVTSAQWIERRDSRSVDANGDVDWGNIDCLLDDDGIYNVYGDWGHLQIKAEGVYVQLE